MTLNIFSISANTMNNRTTVVGEDRYQHCLNLFWNGQSKAAIQFAADEIEKHPAGEEVFRLYRLWIEQLAALGEWDSLKRLGKHLLARGYENPQQAVTWQALRGLIHLELDELQAVSLLLRTLDQRTDNPYCLEFKQIALFRKADTNDFELSLLQSTKAIEDYFLWQTLARGFLLHGRKNDLTRALYHVSQFFPSSPLADEFKYHTHIEAGEYAEACQLAKLLAERFPENSDYEFFLGYSQYQSEDLKGALKTLTHKSSASVVDDPDYLMMAAATHQKIANGDVSNQSHGRAIECFRKLETIYRNENFPISAIRSSIETLETEQRAFMGVDADIGQAVASQAWLVKLTPRLYFEVQTTSQEELSQIVWSMGEQAKAGDMVFFAAEHPLDGGGPWRIVAIYHVVSGPNWSPYTKFESTLELIYRMDTPLEIEVKIRESDERKVKQGGARQQRESLGVFLLEGGALDIITEAVKQRTEIEQRQEELPSTMQMFKKSS